MNISSLSNSVSARLSNVFSRQSRPRYQRVDGAKAGHPKLRFLSVSLTVIVATALLLITFRSKGSRPESESKSSALKITSPPGYFHLLVQTSNAENNGDLCKFLLSAAVLDYPEPTLLGWDHPPPPEKRDGIGKSLLSLAEAKAYLDNLGRARDDDLVLVVDGNSHWFQLRPQTLLDRYFAINRQADQGVRDGLSESVVREHNITQKVLFAAKDECSLGTSQAPSCSAAPASNLPAYAKKHSRFLSPSMILGTAAAMRVLYNETLTRVMSNPEVNSAHAIFDQIFGEQETHRQALKGSWWPGKQGAAEKEDSLDFGIGLDYESTISLDAGIAREGVEWVQHGNADKGHGAMQGDIDRTLPPFWTFSTEPLPRDTSWKEVALLTDLRTRVAPALIQQSEEVRATEWDRIWFQQHVRALYDAHIYSPLGPIAVAGYDKPRRWWSPEDYKGGARDLDGMWIRYEEMCMGTEDEVFRDGKGTWELPENH